MIRDTYVDQVAAPLEGPIREELSGSCDVMIAIDDGILGRTVVEDALRLRKLLDEYLFHCQDAHLFH